MLSVNTMPRLLLMMPIFWLLCCAPARLPAAGEPPHAFIRLMERLQSDGFDPDRLKTYYAAPNVGFEADRLSLFFRHQEARLNYDQFLEEGAIRRARSYMKQHAGPLAEAEAAFGVEKEMITAVMLVETRLGTYLGNSSTLNILSSMASLSDPVMRDMFWQTLQEKTQMNRSDYRAKAKRKSKWAYDELKAFLTYASQSQIANPAAISGSYAGAIGIAQFMPSNILTLGIDGDRDGTVNLFTHSDAIHSIANYLKHHGWHAGMSTEKTRKVLMRYNYSRYYADTLIKIFNKLKENQ